ncbi:MAG: hypothetical protein QG588_1514 [Candidatus Poribacteria bacterium]|nr:hypothetical protein [Candidatus Poribacteria bacterium]
MKRIMGLLCFAFVFLLVFSMILEAESSNEKLVSDANITVDNNDELKRAIAQAKAGIKVLIAPGVYQGGLYFENLKGTPDKPIVISAADSAKPPIIQGGNEGFHFSDSAYIELHNIIISNVMYNGIGVDDGGTFDTPAHHILLKGLLIRDVGPDGNKDGIKLSGVDDFRVEDCIIERWGSGGSAIDMVGCHRGTILKCTFKYNDQVQGNGVQTKGGSSDLIIRECRFEHSGSRSVNIGGSTGLKYFRPGVQGYEAKNITVERCTFIGSQAPIAFVGVDGALVKYNTIYQPKKWVIRILQETQDSGFTPCRNGIFTDNIITFRSDEVAIVVNIGQYTAPETFSFARNFWYCLDNADRSKPDLPTPEIDAIYGKNPLFRDAESGNFNLMPNSPAQKMGVYAPMDYKESK